MRQALEGEAGGLLEHAGPDVKDELKPGDEVLLIGTVGQDVVQLPREKDLLVTRERNVILVVEE